jgi:predicted phage terminase large subunit-like protein
MNPAELRIALDRERLTRKMAPFVAAAWRKIEPNDLRWNWHMDAVCEHLEAVLYGQIRDLLICQPPGTSKSLLASTLWPGWIWAKAPATRIISSTYGQDLTEKNSRLHRDLTLDPWYVERWPEARIRAEDVGKVGMFQNASKGWRFSTSVGGPATGRHADILIFDDLVKAQDAEGRALLDPIMIEKACDFAFKVMRTRRADAATTRQVMIAQRLHYQDPPGRAEERGWTVLRIPQHFDPADACKTRVLWIPPGKAAPEPYQDPRKAPGELLNPDRYPAEVLAADLEAMGPITYEAQHNQRPAPPSGAIFTKVGDARWSVLPSGGRRILTLDCSFKAKSTSDHVAIQAWIADGGRYYLVDEWAGPCTFWETIELAVRWIERFPGYTLHVEDKANGPAVIETLEGEIPGIQAWDPGTADKVSRAHAVSHLFTTGCVLLPPDNRAPWLGAYRDTLHRFPLVRRDDRVDATTMALLILHRPKTDRYLAMIQAMKGKKARA